MCTRLMKMKSHTTTFCTSQYRTPSMHQSSAVSWAGGHREPLLLLLYHILQSNETERCRRENNCQVCIQKWSTGEVCISDAADDRLTQTSITASLLEYLQLSANLSDVAEPDISPCCQKWDRCEVVSSDHRLKPFIMKKIHILSLNLLFTDINQ